MENYDAELIGRLTIKKQEAYLSMLKKRGTYLLRHLRKVEADFLKKYKTGGVSEQQFLHDVKLMFDLYEILIGEITNDLEFTELEAFGQGVHKLFQQIIMIVGFLIKSIFLTAKQDSNHKPETPEATVSPLGTPPEPTNRENTSQAFDEQQRKKQMYEQAEKTYYNLKEESRLYDLMMENDDLRQRQDEVLQNKDQYLQIKQSPLESNLKQAFDYMSQSSNYHRNFIDKAEKRLKEIGFDLAHLESAKQNFFTEQSATQIKKTARARRTCIMLRQFKKSLRSDVATQTDAPHHHRKSVNNVELKGLHKKNSDLEKLKEEQHKLHSELEMLKRKYNEELTSRIQKQEQLQKEKDKLEQAHESIVQYKECLKFRDATIRKMKEEDMKKSVKQIKLSDDYNSSADGCEPINKQPVSPLTPLSPAYPQIQAKMSQTFTQNSSSFGFRHKNRHNMKSVNRIINKEELRDVGTMTTTVRFQRATQYEVIDTDGIIIELPTIREERTEMIINTVVDVASIACIEQPTIPIIEKVSTQTQCPQHKIYLINQSVTSVYFREKNKQLFVVRLLKALEKADISVAPILSQIYDAYRQDKVKVKMHVRTENRDPMLFGDKKLQEFITQNNIEYFDVAVQHNDIDDGEIQVFPLPFFEQPESFLFKVDKLDKKKKAPKDGKYLPTQNMQFVDLFPNDQPDSPLILRRNYSSNRKRDTPLEKSDRQRLIGEVYRRVFVYRTNNRVDKLYDLASALNISRHHIRGLLSYEQFSVIMSMFLDRHRSCNGHHVCQHVRNLMA